MKTYQVNVIRVGQWWDLDAPEVRFGGSQCKRLDQAEAAIREAIAIALDVAEDSFDVDLHIEPPEQVAELLERLHAIEEQVETLQDEYRSDVVSIVKSGLTYRDTGSILGISYQRVGQIVKEYESA